MTGTHSASLDAAFDPESFRTLGHKLIDLLAAHMVQAQERGGMPVLPPSDPQARMKQWQLGEAQDPFDLFSRYVTESNHLRHPRYVGHQVTPTMPLAALADLVSSFMNNGTAVYEMSPVGTPLERIVVQWMCRMIGYPAGADGLLTSGGSLGNLTALLAARQARTGHDVWNEGLGAEPVAILVSEQAHYCIQRAVQVMGMGADAVVAVPTDTRCKMTAPLLKAAFETTVKNGRRPIVVVASACTTALGVFDPIPELADFARREGLWLHVDGAHGAAAALSPRYRHLTAGIGQADSVVFDAHKMLLMPSLLTGVLFRLARHSQRAFNQQASYLFGDQNDGSDGFELGRRTMECTKPTMALKLYAGLAVHGEALFTAHLERSFDLARQFAVHIRATPDFELALEPECNIVCFRYVPDGLSGRALDALQERIRRRIVASGAFYLVQAGLKQGTFLRITVMNPKTDEADLLSLLDAVRAAAE